MSTLALVVGPAAGLAGVALGYAGTRRVSKNEREAAAQAELRRAVAAFLAALYPVIAELRAMPEVRQRAFDARLDRLRGEAATYVLERRRAVKLGERPWQLADRLAAANANLQVLEIPPELQTAVSAANAYAEELTHTRTVAVIARWDSVWAQLQAAVKSVQVPT